MSIINECNIIKIKSICIFNLNDLLEKKIFLISIPLMQSLFIWAFKSNKKPNGNQDYYVFCTQTHKRR